MISERILKMWRGQTLKDFEEIKGWNNDDEFTSIRRVLATRILSLTQELLDQHLLNKANNK